MENTTDYLRQVAASVLRVMREHQKLTFLELNEHVSVGCKASGPSVRRALRWLQEKHDAPIFYDRRIRRWVLEREEFSLPILDPTPDDVVAAALAGALVNRFGDEDLDSRMQSLLMELDERTTAGKLRNNVVVGTSSARMKIESRTVTALATAVGRAVVRVSYRSPWSEKPTVKSHVIEPWQLRVHDGNLYVRAWLRGRNVVTTLNVSHIQSITSVDDSPIRARPPTARIWDGRSLGQDVDTDHADQATVRIRGPLARYIALVVWHDEQRDVWIQQDEVLQRDFSYSSRRATARRLLALGDALVCVAPASLREEVVRHAGVLAKVEAPCAGMPRPTAGAR